MIINSRNDARTYSVVGSKGANHAERRDHDAAHQG